MSLPRAAARRLLGALAGAMALVACLDLSGPGGGVFAVSELRLPWPSVVVGDTMRDSTGAAVPLAVNAYGGDGQLLSGETRTFFVVGDSTGPASAVDPTTHVLVGLRIRPADSTATTQASVDTIAVAVGGLQSNKAVAYVVPRPDVVHRAGTVLEDTVVLAADTTIKAGRAIPVKVWHRRVPSDSVGVRGWVVSYWIERQPESADTSLVAFLGSGATRTTHDTTDATGLAQLNLLYRAHRLKHQRDSVIVRARAVYRGQDLPGTSELRFVVPILDTVIVR